MKITNLYVHNISDYDEILDEDIAESIGREFYCGIAASDDGERASGAMIWEYRNLEDDTGALAELMYINADSKEDADALLAEFSKQASAENVTDVFFETAKLSDDATAVFEGHDFGLRSDESRDIVVSVSELSKLAAMVRKIPENIESLEEIKEIQFMQGVTNCIFHGRKGLLEDLEYLEKDWFAEDLSCCVITDNKVSGLFLVHRLPSGTLMPVLLTAIGPDARRDILYMICFSAQKALSLCSPETGILVRRYNDSVRSLAKKLFPDKTGKAVLVGEKKQ